MKHIFLGIFAAVSLLSTSIQASPIGTFHGHDQKNNPCTVIIKEGPEGNKKDNEFEVIMNGSDFKETSIMSSRFQRSDGEEMLMHYEQGWGFVVPWFFNTLFVHLDKLGHPISAEYSDNLSSIFRKIHGVKFSCLDLHL